MNIKINSIKTYLSKIIRLLRMNDEELSKKEIKQFLKKDSPIILEIGSNNGNDSLEFLENFNNVSLYCFEPDPRQIANFKKNVKDSRCKLYEFALSNKKGRSEFHISESKDQSKVAEDSSSLKKPKKHLERFPWIKFDKKIKVKTETLDNWAKKTKIKKIDFIWADVQGAEKELIEGGIKTLNKKTKYLYTEFFNEELYEEQISLKQILKLLPNFRIVKIYGNNVLLKNTSLFTDSFIISCAQGGLSNRIKCLISSKILSKEKHRELRLYWPKDNSCNVQFEDLFENRISKIEKEDLRKILKRKNFSINEMEKNKKFWLIDDPEFKLISKNAINFKFEEVPKDVRTKILSNLKNLKVNSELLNKVSKFYKNNFSKETIGVHIRKRDFKNLSSGIGNISSDRLFIDEIKKEINENPKANFFISSDEKKIVEVLNSIFKEKIISYPKKTSRREEEGAVKEALIENLLLSKCKKIIGTYGSTFSELAWYFGEGKAKIKIIRERNELRKYLSIKKESPFLKIKKFIYELIFPIHKRMLDKK